MDFLAFPRHIEPIQCLDRRFRLAACGPECREVVPPHQQLRCLVHGRRIERYGLPPDAIAIERWRRAPVQNAIKVMPSGRGKARVEIVGYQGAL